METTLVSPDGRIRDLISTADRQLTSRSYDAAIDTYRTALAELPGDAAADLRAGIEARLNAASRAREVAQRVAGLLRDARYHQTAGRLSEAFAAVTEALSLDSSDQPATQLREQLLNAMPQLAIAAAAPVMKVAPVVDAAPVEAPAPLSVMPVPAAEPAVEPEPPPPEADMSLIEPPSFHLIEDDPYVLERAHHDEYTDEAPLSILDPVPRPDPLDQSRAGIVIFAVACILALAVAFGSVRHVIRPSAPSAAPADHVAYEPVYSIGGDVTAPVLISKVEPVYTEEAGQAHHEGTVVLHVEVDPSGNAVNIRVLRRLGMGLDARAIEAVSHWRFQPGMKDGRPVTVAMKIEVNFRLP